MTVLDQISQLPKEDKLKIMEELWLDLGKDDFRSPEWHKDALEATLQKYEKGEETVIDWDIAKKTLKG